MVEQGEGGVDEGEGPWLRDHHQTLTTMEGPRLYGQWHEVVAHRVSGGTPRSKRKRVNGPYARKGR